MALDIAAAVKKSIKEMHKPRLRTPCLFLQDCVKLFWDDHIIIEEVVNGVPERITLIHS